MGAAQHVDDERALLNLDSFVQFGLGLAVADLDAEVAALAERGITGDPIQEVSRGVRLAALRDTGGLRDLAAVERGIGDAGNPIPLAVDWGQNLRAACACEHFFPGSSGLPPDQIPAPDRVHGVDAPVTSD